MVDNTIELSLTQTGLQLQSDTITKKPLVLKPFQLAANKRMTAEARHFLLFKMGLGKTPTTVVSGYETQIRNWLILCPKNAIRTWEDHIKEWFPVLDTQRVRTTPYMIWRYRRKYNNREARHKLWQQNVPDAINIYIMTYGGYLQDQEVIKHQFDIVICDEAKRIRNRKSKIFSALKPLCKAAKFFWPMTGTPGKLPLDTWTMFHLADPHYYRSYWKFVNAFHYTMKNEWGANEVLGIRNTDQWYRTLKSKASIVTKEMVKDQIGESSKTRQLLHIEMDDEQQAIYDQLKQEMISLHGDTLILSKNTLHQSLQFRQLLTCPKILSDKFGYGQAIADFIATLEDTDPHVVLFTPFVEAIPHFQKYLADNGHFSIALHGGITPDEQAARIAEYRARRGIAIVSIMYAQSFSLEPAAEAFFIGYDFDPENNEQAEDRLVRFTTNYPVNIYYYAYEDTYDSVVADIVCIKHLQIQKTFDISQVGLTF